MCSIHLTRIVRKDKPGWKTTPNFYNDIAVKNIWFEIIFRVLWLLMEACWHSQIIFKEAHCWGLSFLPFRMAKLQAESGYQIASLLDSPKEGRLQMPSKFCWSYSWGSIESCLWRIWVNSVLVLFFLVNSSSICWVLGICNIAGLLKRVIVSTIR